ncbi:MAG: hypothetical protein GY757_22600 [bacterium]|nr:hypothetical protein [bacterium]
MKKAIILCILLVVLICAAWWLFYPRGEEADWARLQDTLGQPGKRTTDSPRDKFPIVNDLDGAEEQLDAIRVFVETYRQSPHIETIIRDYLLPNLWIDIENNGISGTYGNRYLSELAMTYHERIKPKEKKKFFQVIQDELAKIENSGEFAGKLSDDLKEEEMYDFKENLKNSDIPEQTKKRLETLKRLSYPGTHGAATPAFLNYIESLQEEEPVIELQVTGSEPEKGLLAHIASEVGGYLSREAGVTAARKKYLENRKVTAKLLISVLSEIEKIGVTVSHIPTSSTQTTQKLSRQWNNGLQRWEYQRTATKTAKTEGRRESQATYPLLKAEITFQTADGNTLWKGKITSGWSFNHFKGKIAVWEIGEGSEVVDGSYSYSAENLALRSVYILIGEALDFK